MAQQQHKEQSRLATASLVILAVVALAVALIYTRAVMIPFVVAVFIVALVSPVQDFQVKRLRLPRVISVVVTLLFVLLVVSIVSFFIAQAITTIVSTAGEYSASFADMTARLLKPVEYLYEQKEPPEPVAPNSPPQDTPPESVQARKGPMELFPRVQDTNGLIVLDMRPPAEPPAQEPNDAVVSAAEEADPNALAETGIRIDTKQIVMDLKNYIFNVARNAFGTVLGLISGVLFVCIFTFFLLAGRNPYSEHSQVYKDVVQKIRRYVGIHFVMSAVTGTLVWTTLTLIGLPLAEVFGVLAFLLNWIPSIGSVVVTLLPVPIAVAEFHDQPLLLVLVVAIPGAIQNLLGNIIEPKLMGEGLNLHPVTILLALSFWGLIWGIVGMFLAAPITAAIRIVLMQFETLRPVGNLLAGDFTTPSSLPPARRREAESPAPSRPPEPPVASCSTPPAEAESGGSPPE